MGEGEGNSWNEWSNHVLLELKRLNTCYESLDCKFNTLREDIIILKVKAGFWGLIGGAIPVIGLLLLEFFRGKI